MKRARGLDPSKVLFFGIMLSGLVVVGYALSVLSPAPASDWEAPEVVGKIESAELKESSGLAASECQDVLWTHNDAGNEPVIFAMDTQGRHLGTWRVPNVQNKDWESIAGYRDKSGKCSLLIGDIGDNDLVRDNVQILRIAEPVIPLSTAGPKASSILDTEVPEIMNVSYSDRRHNAETLLVHPETGNIYIVTKEKTGPAAVHRIKPEFGLGSTVKTEKVADVSVPRSPEGLLTGGSFSPDGRRVMLCDLRAGYELVLPGPASDPDAIWSRPPSKVNIGNRKQGEGVSYARDGQSLFASSEKKNTELYRIRRKSR